MDIKYAVTHRHYESRAPGVAVWIYAGDDGGIFSNDPHSKFCHTSYLVPAEELSVYELERIETAIRERYADGTGFRREEHRPSDPISRSRLIEEFGL